MDKTFTVTSSQCHPDLFPDNEEKTKEFQELQSAYSILSDTKTRAAYSQSQPNSAARQPDPFKHRYSEFSGGSPRQSNPHMNRFIAKVFYSL